MTQNRKSLPLKIKKLFWDSNPETVKLNENKKFIIERVLEYGDLPEFEWLKKTYTEKDIVKTLKESNRLSPKTANFYTHIYNLNPIEVPCMKKLSTPKHERF